MKLELRRDKKAFYEESRQIPLTVFFYDLQRSENTSWYKNVTWGKVDFKVPSKTHQKSGGHLSHFLLFKAPFGQKKTFKFEKRENGASTLLFVPNDRL